MNLNLYTDVHRVHSHSKNVSLKRCGLDNRRTVRLGNEINESGKNELEWSRTVPQSAELNATGHSCYYAALELAIAANVVSKRRGLLDNPSSKSPLRSEIAEASVV